MVAAMAPTLAVTVTIGLLAAVPVQAFEAEAGHQLARMWCASCHQIEPDGATSDAAPGFQMIADDPERTPERLRAWLTDPPPARLAHRPPSAHAQAAAYPPGDRRDPGLSGQPARQLSRDPASPAIRFGLARRSARAARRRGSHRARRISAIVKPKPPTRQVISAIPAMAARTPSTGTANPVDTPPRGGKD
jgi:hypothetical protein